MRTAAFFAASALLSLAVLVSGCDNAPASKDAPSAKVEVTVPAPAAAPAPAPAAAPAKAAPAAPVPGSTAIVFPAGGSGTTVRGSVKGYDAALYSLNARAGQTAKVVFKPTNTSAYFNVYAPGVVPGEGEALFIGASSGNSWEAVLPTSGDYTVQVYLYRNAARRDETSDFALDASVR